MLYSVEDFSLDTARWELRRGGALIALQPQVFDLLEYSIRNRDRIVSKDDAGEWFRHAARKLRPEGIVARALWRRCRWI